MEVMKPAIVVHGGAWAIPEYLIEESCNGVQEAATCGYKILKAGGSALDAVSSAIRCLEDNPAFDAGTGSVLTVDGKIEMDAIIMEGRTLNVGAVACVQNVKYPSQLARLVMEKTRHNCLIGPAANEFGWQHGMEYVSTELLTTEEARREYETYKKYKTAVNTLFNGKGLAQTGHETVGVVAVDSDGNVACTTSTGGIASKLAGRIGDSPLIGSGGYCCNEVGAVSTTGFGEAIMRVCLARRAIWHMSKGSSAQEAAEKALSFMSQRIDGYGGCIVVDKDGNIGRHFTTERMAWAAFDKEGTLKHGINPGDGYQPIWTGAQPVSLPKHLDPPYSEPVIVVHSGAGSVNFPAAWIQPHLDGCKMAAKAGMEILQSGGTAMDAVVAAVDIFDRDPVFNAGKGSKLTANGDVEMEALVIDGKTLKAGAVWGIDCCLYTTRVARRVMDKTDHVLLCGEGANKFAKEQGFDMIDKSELITERTKEQLELFLEMQTKGMIDLPIEHDTVGAVALDRHGNLATACSTGGLNGKMPGRFGDSPVIGGGSYCDNDIGGVTVTGHGESLSKVCISRHVTELMEEGETAQSACDKALNAMATRLNLGNRVNMYGGGAIAIGRNGDVGVSENTGKLSYAYIKGSEVHCGCNMKENFIEHYEFTSSST